ncbi:hypothetical protein ACOSQ4_004017 [Xanthoceras sorbifolium]
MTAFKAILLSSFAHSTSSILRNGVSSLSKHFTTSHPKSIISRDEARVHEFLHGKCKSGKINLHEALYFFDYMIHMQPTPPMYSFNVLFIALVKSKHYGDVISLHIRMNSVGVRRVGDARKLFDDMQVYDVTPNSSIFAAFIDGLCKNYCRNLIPNATTFYIVINWLAKGENYRHYLNSLSLFPVQESTRR